MALLITYAQKSKIFATAKELGIDNDLLHELVFAETSCSSIRDLTWVQAARVIDRLEGKLTPKGMATPAQRRFIESLAKELGWKTDDGAPDMNRIEGFLKARFDVASYRWLSVQKAGKVIEAIKDMKKREQNNKTSAS